MKVIYIATVVKTHIMEFHIPYLKMFKEMGWETAVAARNDYKDPSDCKIPYCDEYFDIPFERNPFKPGNIKAYKMLKKILDSGEYDIIHCHTPVGGMLTRLASKHARKNGSKVFYTAHGFHFFKGAPLINWLAYYPVEKILAHKTDVLITINKEDYERGKSFKAKSVEYVPGVGIDLQRFRVDNDPSERHEMRASLGVSDDDILLLSVGELIPRKNHEVVLRALALLNKEHPVNNIRYIVAGDGKLREYLEGLTKDLGLSDKVMFLGYRRDIPKICRSCDMFVFMSKQEGLPVALMESMACGLPAICTDIRGNTDLIENGKDGLVIGNDAKQLCDAISSLMGEPEKMREYSANAAEIVKKFEINNVVRIMCDIYDRNVEGADL